MGQQKPLRIAVSTCLLGQRVRWDGEHSHAPSLVAALEEVAELTPLCPEADLGMGVPREPVQLEGPPGAPRMVGVGSGRDWTVDMLAFLDARVAAVAAEGVAGWVLRARSPSCGLRDVKLFPAREAADPPPAVPYSVTGSGLLVRTLRRRLPHLPLATDALLASEGALSDFLLRVRLYAAFQARGPERDDLLRFHAEHGGPALGPRGRDAADRLLGRRDLPVERQAARYAAVLFHSLAYDARRR